MARSVTRFYYGYPMDRRLRPSEPPMDVPSQPVPRTQDVEVEIPGRGYPPADSSGAPIIVLSDRRPRHDITTSLYAVQRSLVNARIHVRTLLAPVAGDARSSETLQPASMIARLTRLQADADRVLIVAARLIRSIEGSAGLPSPEERRQTAIAIDDAARLVAELAETAHDPWNARHQPPGIRS